MSATGSGFTERSFGLLRELRENNETAWFHEHREQFRQYLLEPFEQLLEEASDRLAASDHPLRGGRRTMFRLNRDVRFSADKSPYTCQVSGLLTPRFRHSMRLSTCSSNKVAPVSFRLSFSITLRRPW